MRATILPLWNVTLFSVIATCAIAHPSSLFAQNSEPVPPPVSNQESEQLPWRSVNSPPPPQRVEPANNHSVPQRISQRPQQAQPIPATEPQLFPEGTAGDIRLTSGTEPDVTGSNENANITRVTSEINELPNSAGQVWREYDISPYTYNITNSTRPQQAVIDWVLRETGTELWFNEPLGILSASKDKLRVYHTPQVQAQVRKVVDRFVYNKGRTETMSLKLVTINNPSWRQTAYTKLQPIPVKSQAIEGWMVSKENAAFLLNELSRRNDFRMHSSGDVVLHDGQKFNISSQRPINFVRSIQWLANGAAQPLATQLLEGYSLDFSTLGSIDNKTCEAMINCQVNQIERLQRVAVNVPLPTGQNQPFELQIPQMVSWNVKERFRWPADQVLLLSCGVVATPDNQPNNPLDVGSFINGSRRRADALLFVEYKGPAPKDLPVTNASPAPLNRR